MFDGRPALLLRGVCDFSALNEVGSDEDISSIFSNPTDSSTRGTSGLMADDKGNESKASKGKETASSTSSTTSSSRKSAKLSNLEKLESKTVNQMTSKFESMDCRFDRLFSLFSAQNSDSVLRWSENNVDSGTSGERRPLNTGRNDTSGGRVIPLDNRLTEGLG